MRYGDMPSATARGGDPGQPSSNKAIPDQIQLLSQKIDTLDKTVQCLIDRLTPVMGPSDPLEVGKAVPHNVPLAGAIQAQSDRISEIGQVLASVIDRLEV